MIKPVSCNVSCNSNHVLASLLPKKELAYRLRPRSHDFVLPNYNTSKLSDKTFFNRVLSKNMY